MKLKLVRVEKNLTQKDLSKLSGIATKTIIKIEKGDISHITFGTLKKIADAVGVEFEKLFLY